MKYLFIDASENCTHAQIGNGHQYLFRTFDTDRNLVAQITSICDQMLQEQTIRINELDMLAVCTGPGSLTGLRVAAGFLRTVAMFRELPIIGINLFEWSLQTLNERAETGKVNLVLPTLIDKAFLASGNIADLSFSGPELVERKSIISPAHDLYAIRGMIPGLQGLTPSSSALDILIKSRQSKKSYNFSELLEVLPMYVIPSQAERKLEEKQ